MTTILFGESKVTSWKYDVRRALSYQLFFPKNLYGWWSTFVTHRTWSIPSTNCGQPITFHAIALSHSVMHGWRMDMIVKGKIAQVTTLFHYMISFSRLLNGMAGTMLTDGCSIAQRWSEGVIMAVNVVRAARCYRIDGLLCQYWRLLSSNSVLVVRMMRGNQIGTRVNQETKQQKRPPSQRPSSQWPSFRLKRGETDTPTVPHNKLGIVV